MADNDSGVGSFGWFLAGLGIGALVGVLYAPKSGKETRDDLVAGALEAKDRANQYYAQGKDQVGQYVAQGKEQVGQYVAQGKQKAAEYAATASDLVDQGKTQLSQYVEKGKAVAQNQADAVREAVGKGKEAYVAKTSEIAQDS